MITTLVATVSDDVQERHGRCKSDSKFIGHRNSGHVIKLLLHLTRRESLHSLGSRDLWISQMD